MNSEQIRKDVTERVVALLESGNVSKWVKPWVTFGSPRNLNSGRKYSGLLNIMLLQQVGMMAEYALPLWATFKQVQALGGSVLKDQHGTRIVFWKSLNQLNSAGVIEEPDELGLVFEGKITKPRYVLQYFTVFNVAQTTLDSVQISEQLGLVMRDHAPEEALEAFAKVQGIGIFHGGDRAYYDRVGDYVQMPVIGAFKTREDYYSTLFHELVHSTGHVTRLNRNQSGLFGSEEYAREELVAELGSLYLCAELGLEGQLQHPEYLKGWIDILKSNSSEIFKIAGKAKEAVDYLVAKAQPVTGVESASMAS